MLADLLNERGSSHYVPLVLIAGSHPRLGQLGGLDSEVPCPIQW